VGLTREAIFLFTPLQTHFRSNKIVNVKEKVCAVYILTNLNHTVLYTGVTSNLPKRILEHKNRINPKCFSAKYNLTKLVWFETTPNIKAAIEMEKKIKAGSREKKMALISKKNPFWKDLSYIVLGKEEWEV
jgi:putative endonuclease